MRIIQIPINSSFVIIFLFQELHVVNTADMLYKKIFNKYFYIIRSLQWCFNGIVAEIPRRNGPGATLFVFSGAFPYKKILILEDRISMYTLYSYYRHICIPANLFELNPCTEPQFSPVHWPKSLYTPKFFSLSSYVR